MNRRQIEELALMFSAIRARASRDKTDARVVRLNDIRDLALVIAGTLNLDATRFLRSCGFHAKDDNVPTAPRYVENGVAIPIVTSVLPE